MKKKLLRGTAGFMSAVVTAASLTSAVPSAASSQPDGFYLRGDVVNNDGITNKDALSVQRYMLGLEELTDEQLIPADSNADGFVNLADAVNIMQWNISPKKQSRVGEYIRQGKINGEIFEVNAPQTGTDLVFNAECDGNYKFRIKYTNLNGEMSYRVFVNGSNMYTPVELVSADSGDSAEAVCVIELLSGENRIEIVTEKNGSEAHIETVEICRSLNEADTMYMDSVTSTHTTSSTTATTTTTAPPQPVAERYYAVDAEIYDGIEETVNSGFAGEAYVNYNNVTGSYVNWTINVPEDGNYSISFRFANGTETNRPVRINVNGGKECCYVDFNGTGDWTQWETNSVVLALKAGTNTIKATATTANGGPNMDYIEVIKTDMPAVEMEAPKDGVRVENLNRGVSAAYTGSGVLVSWRILGTDSENTTFKLFKNGQQPPIYEGTLNDASCFLDKNGKATDWYTIDTYVGSECTEFAQASINLTNKNSGQSGAYFDIPLNTPPGGTTPKGEAYTYTANDCSVGDIDGDGQYEIFVKWDPSNSQDNANAGYTGNVYIDCYTLSGKQLWRVDLGKNIRAGAHYTQFMVYDFDGDNKAEMICKTADGTVDGTGKVIGDGSADYRMSGQVSGKRGDPTGKILSGPEYLTLFDGATGKALDTIEYKPSRGDADAWGDQYGNRVDRFTACVAYLDGTTPSAVFGRGYYSRSALTAYNVVNGRLQEYWAYDTGHNSSAAGYANGNHHILAADVDGDGRQEVVVGSAVVDDNGKLLYSSGLGHGDAIHVGDFDPSNPGVEIFQCHEEGNKDAGTGYGISLRDGKTGKLLFRQEAGGDTGRCIADNLIAGNAGAEMVGSHNSIVYSAAGSHNQVAAWADITKWGMNSVVYWSDVLERAVLDRTMVDQHGKGRVFTGDGVDYNNYSKSNACLTADIFGDWREELIFRKADGSGLRVFATTFETQYPIYTLMHNPQYRVQVASENNGYNQPPHVDYFLGTGYDLPKAPEVYSN